MTWPKRHTRTVHTGGKEYLWHLSGNSIHSPARVTVGTESGRYYLFIDPYAHDFEITPSSVRAATEWALAEGWSPEVGPTKAMAYSMEKKEYFWLPDDARFSR